jgi:hypothetical protein
MSEGRLSQEPLTLEGVEKTGFSFFGKICEMLISKSFSKKVRIRSSPWPPRLKAL